MIASRDDLMIENNQILNREKFVKFAFYPCNQKYEKKIGSKVECKTEAEVLQYFEDEQLRVTFWWLDQFVMVDKEVIEHATAHNPMSDRKPYYLFPRKQQVSLDVKSEEVITLKYTNNFFSYIDESSENKLNSKIQNFGKLDYFSSQKMVREKQ